MTKEEYGKEVLEFEEANRNREKIEVIDCIFSERDGRELAAQEILSCKKTLKNAEEALSQLIVWVLLREGREKEYIDEFLARKDPSWERELIAKRIIDICIERATKKKSVNWQYGKEMGEDNENRNSDSSFDMSINSGK